MKSVIQPLVNASATIKVKVEVIGSSQEGIPPNTIEFVIKEGLNTHTCKSRAEEERYARARTILIVDDPPPVQS